MKQMLLRGIRGDRYTCLLLILGTFMLSVFIHRSTDIPKTLWVYVTPRPTTGPNITMNYTGLPTHQTKPTTRHPLIPPYPHDYKFILNEPDKCKPEAPFLVILVIGNANDYQARHAVRSTWGNESNVPGVSVIRLFLTGIAPRVQKMLEEESATFHDIIQQDFLDTYNNLTLKTLMGMEWVAKHCPNASYVMKIDNDMFLNVDFLVHNLLIPGIQVRRNYMSCNIVRNAEPQRTRGYKYYVPKEVYPRNKYPPYCSGPGYVLSGDLAKKIYDVAQTMQLINMEDCFTGLCMVALKLNLTIPPKGVFNGHHIEYDRCRFSSLITVHHYSPQRLMEIWPDFQSRNVSECETSR
ncbi:beta-1,3-galactosyltransferase 2-like [Ambystoma mexicanum]|uniref:beta-1,3-galactosyltransferase 2-like n=1 Tax=Ambystoma mexicanum TaxID=8296 RepID=UPI0037E7BF30